MDYLCKGSEKYMKVNKLISISTQEEKWVKDEAKEKEITFSEMLRRIIDDRYDKQEEKQNGKS